MQTLSLDQIRADYAAFLYAKDLESMLLAMGFREKAVRKLMYGERRRNVAAALPRVNLAELTGDDKSRCLWDREVVLAVLAGEKPIL